MFFDSPSDILRIAKNTGFSIFSLESPASVRDILVGNNVFFLSPDEQSEKISIESVRDFISSTTSKEKSDKFYIIISPETMSLEASNAILKTLEEPKDFYHFVFLTSSLSSLLPTILSRAEIFFERKASPLDAPPIFDEEIISLAKRMMVLRERDYPTFAKEIADKKDRVLAEKIVSAAIELSYKSFLKTKNPTFLKKLPNYIKLYENLEKNGHIKLHFLADLM